MTDGEGAAVTELRAWLTECAAGHVRRSPEDIDPATPLSSYGMDSVAAMAMLVEIENHVGVQLDANTMWDFPTVDALVELLAGKLRSATG